MESTLSGTISNNVLAVPADYLELDVAVVSSATRAPELQRKSKNWLYSNYPRSAGIITGVPKYIARDGNNFVFGPLPDSNYTITGTYYAQPALLSDSNPTNYFIQNTPDLLLFAALVKAEPYLKNDERLPLWQSQYQEILNDVMMQEKDEEFSGSDLNMTRLPC
jgi:hypothetical protein